MSAKPELCDLFRDEMVITGWPKGLLKCGMTDHAAMAVH
jgi:hypothetical protein